MLVYVHLPLCRRKCRYCAFVSWPFAPADAARIVDLVAADAARWGGLRGGVRARTVYLGGGTPSLWAPAQLGRILEAVARHLDLEAGAEVTVEANPDSALAPGWLASLPALGVTRVSLGVQSFHDPLLAFLGRPHRGAQARAAVEAAVATGLAVSVDLVWGVPGQTLAMWAADLRHVLALGVAHVSCYALTAEPGTPLARDPAPWPAEDEAAAQYELACEVLEAGGLVQYELANWAWSGFACRHNLGYWRGEDYLGLGPAAVSTWQGRRWTNPASVEGYAAVVAGARRPVAETITPLVAARERLMLALRTREGLDVAALGRELGQDLLAAGADVWRALSQAGLARLEGARLRLTRRGMLVGNAVSAHLLAQLDGWLGRWAETM